MELYRALPSETEEFTRNPSRTVAAEKRADQNVGVVTALIIMLSDAAGAPDGMNFLDYLPFS